RPVASGDPGGLPDQARLSERERGVARGQTLPRRADRGHAGTNPAPATRLRRVPGGDGGLPRMRELQGRLDTPALRELRGDGQKDAAGDGADAVARGARGGEAGGSSADTRTDHRVGAAPRFSERERQILEAVVDTAMPPGTRWPKSARELGIAERMEDFFADEP